MVLSKNSVDIGYSRIPFKHLQTNMLNLAASWIRSTFSTILSELANSTSFPQANEVSLGVSGNGISSKNWSCFDHVPIYNGHFGLFLTPSFTQWKSPLKRCPVRWNIRSQENAAGCGTQCQCLGGYYTPVWNWYQTCMKGGNWPEPPYLSTKSMGWTGANVCKNQPNGSKQTNPYPMLGIETNMLGHE